jgi:hypothetical protein
MKRYVLPVIASSIVLLALSFGVLYFSINFLTGLVEEYYNPVFYPGEERSNLFFLHPLIISLALIWIWRRIENSLKGNWFMKGIEFGLLYAFIATLPSMWITFSAIDVSFIMVALWWGYGLLQATVAGWVFASFSK